MKKMFSVYTISFFISAETKAMANWKSGNAHSLSTLPPHTPVLFFFFQILSAHTRSHARTHTHTHTHSETRVPHPTHTHTHIHAHAQSEPDRHPDRDRDREWQRHRKRQRDTERVYTDTVNGPAAKEGDLKPDPTDSQQEHWQRQSQTHPRGVGHWVLLAVLSVEAITGTPFFSKCTVWPGTALAYYCAVVTALK